MLDNEPDTDQPTTEQPATEEPAAEAAPPPRRRRRAASRPAGPPSTAPDAPAIEQVAVEPAPEVPPEAAGPGQADPEGGGVRIR